MLVLGIESTCDETACALVRNGNEILANVISSQTDLHREFGGVVPELACRRHVDAILPVIKEALSQAACSLHQVDLIAVAHGPGLIGALLIGLNTAKALSLALDKPLIGVNHIEAHLYASIMSQTSPPPFPCLGVVLSGGHTSLLKINNLGHYELISQTVDDAIGEAFDKAAKILGLPYPGGPEIERLAKEGNAKRFAFKSGQIKKKPLYFSFSGLKTAVLYTVNGQNGHFPKAENLTHQDRCDLAASFQAAAFQDILNKTLAAADQYRCSTILFGGGVANSTALRLLFEKQAERYRLLWPAHGLSLDNAAMIAGLGFHTFQQRGKGDTLELDPMTRFTHYPQA